MTSRDLFEHQYFLAPIAEFSGSVLEIGSGDRPMFPTGTGPGKSSIGVLSQSQSSSVDLVVWRFVLCSSSNSTLLLADVWRVLKSGGTLLCLEHTERSGRVSRTLQRILSRMLRLSGWKCDLASSPENKFRNSMFSESYAPAYYFRRGLPWVVIRAEKPV